MYYASQNINLNVGCIGVFNPRVSGNSYDQCFWAQQSISE